MVIRLSLLVFLLAPLACRVQQHVPRRPLAEATAYAPPSDALIPPGAEGASIRRGRALLLHTRDSLPTQVGNRLRCTSCHLDGAVRPGAMSLAGVYARYPQYRPRSAIVERLEDRINDCFRRSMNGAPLEVEGADMRDMIAWLAWISRGVPLGSTVAGQGSPAVPPRVPDLAAGASLFAADCSRCHGQAGEGTVIAPPVWGDSSYNIGAGMARLRTLAAFLRHNMPYDRPASLTDQQAYDLAGYINAQPRPDFPGKELDWPSGDPPPDVAYPTRAARSRRQP